MFFCRKPAPTPFQIGKRPPAPENQPAIAEEPRGGGGGHPGSET